MKKALFYFLFFMTLLVRPCFAATVYVDSDCTNGISTYNPGGDACTGGSDTVYSSIQNAADAVTSGIVEIRAGTYSERVKFDTNSGAGITPRSDASYIVFKPYSAEAVTVTTGAYNTILILEDWIKIEGLIIKNTWGAGHGIMIGGESDPDTDGSSNNWIYNNEVDGASISNFGIQIVSTTCLTCDFDNNIIESNTVHDLDGEGIYFNLYDNFSGSYDGNQILNNTVYNCYEAIQLSQEGNQLALGAPTNSIVRGNTIYDNGGGGFAIVYCAGDGTLCEDNIIYDNGPGGYIGGMWVFGDDIIIRNNLIYNNDGGNASDAGIVIDGPNAGSGISSTGIVIYHNTIERHGGTGSGNYGIYLRSNDITATAKNNIIANNTGAGISVVSGPTLTCSNNVRYGNGSVDVTCTDDQTGDPTFVSVVDGSEDYKLQAGSSAINKGVDVSISDDIEGTTRVGYDIGAYEYGGVVLPVMTSIQIGKR